MTLGENFWARGAVTVADSGNRVVRRVLAQQAQIDLLGLDIFADQLMILRLGEQDERGCDEGDDAYDVEAVHEGEQLGLGVQLIVDMSVGCSDGVCGGHALGMKIGCRLVDVLL